MNKSLYELHFEARFAVRVLERQGRYWRKMDAGIKVLSLLAGSTAFAALTHGNAGLTLGLGLVFAFAQALEFAVQPARHAAQAFASCKAYARLSTDAHLWADADALALALQRTRADDDVTVFDSINRLAYADVATELGRPECIDPPGYWLQTMRLLA